MKARTVIVIIIVLLIGAAGMVIIAWNSKPKIIETFPQAGGVNIPSTSPVRWVFSHAMDQQSVIARLKIDPALEGSFSWDKNTLTFTPNQPWPGGRKVNLQLDAGARSVSWISFPMGKHSWSFTTGVEMLAYLWPSDGNADIYALDPITGLVRQYTFGLGVLEYSANSDGKMFYFSAGNSLGGADLYQIDRTRLEGASGNSNIAEKLLDCGTAQCRSPEVSFDDHTLAYEYILPSPGGDAGPAQIWILDLESKEETAIGQETHETVQPSWSTTGLLTYYDQTSGGYEVFNLATHERVKFSNQTGQPGVWSPAGEFYLAPEISYLQAATGTETGISHLIRYDIQSNTTEDISGDKKVEDVEAKYSPDGSMIAFARKFLDAEKWSFGRQVWIMKADGLDQQPITSEADYNHYDIAWSRDGRMLAYVRFNQAKLSDAPELWMVNTDGRNPIQLVIGGYSPIWIP